MVERADARGSRLRLEQPCAAWWWWRVAVVAAVCGPDQYSLQWAAVGGETQRQHHPCPQQSYSQQPPLHSSVSAVSTVLLYLAHRIPDIVALSEIRR